MPEASKPILTQTEANIKCLAEIELREGLHYLKLGLLESALVCIRSAMRGIEDIKVLRAER